MSNDPTSSDPNPSNSTDFTPPELSEIAELLPAYEILSFIAKGGMGAVYMARQKSLDRDVAIKVLPRHFGEDAEFRASFEAEAKSMAKFNHPNLISIYDFGQVDGLLYIIMEMVQGKSLYYSSYGKTIEPSEAARITSAVCHGLANAHKHGILHRDIKPANILLDPSASPKIGDFGLARPVGDHEADSAYGTPGYTAPEVVHNPTAVDESTDIYSVGAMLYELLTSKLPDSHYVPASTLVQCDPKFDKIIRKAMHPAPALRYRSAEAMAKAIDEVAKDTPSSETARTLLTAPSKTKSTAPARLTAPGAKGKSPSSGGTSTTPTPVRPPTPGSNAPLIRNVIIILGLLAGIYVAWEGLKVVRAKNAEEQAFVEQANQEAKDAAAQKRKEEAAARALANPGKPNRKPVEKIDIPIKVETPLETLSRLKSQLLSGSRVEMPKGSITQSGKARFYIDNKMTWHQARQFCENHGGHLTILTEASDLLLFSSKLKSDQIIWLGAGSDGNKSWQWIDGSPWQHGDRKTSKSAYVSVDQTGILDYQSATTKHSFFIEWNIDGSMPATLENQLKRTAESITEGNPVYPPGTLSYDNRYYLLIQQDAGWDAANNFARQGGANLAIPSNLDENEWLLSFLASSLQSNQACWIGGIRQPNVRRWDWSTGEDWLFARWGEGLPNENASISCGCAVLSSQKWDDYPIDKELPYFIIEWSKDGKGKAVVQVNNGPKANAIVPFRKKCIAGIKSIQKDFEKEFNNNIKGFEQELSVFKRSLVHDLQESLAPGILAMQDYPNNRIRENLPRDGMPAKMAEILDSRLRRQKETETKFLVQIGALRLKYRAALQDEATKLKSKGLNAQLQDIQQELNDTPSQGYKFIDHIMGGIKSAK